MHGCGSCSSLSLLLESITVLTANLSSLRDQESNIVLAHTYEYRPPTEEQRVSAMTQAAGSNVTLDMTSRYLGLVVVPGHRITKMEVERFASQMGQWDGQTVV